MKKALVIATLLCALASSAGAQMAAFEIQMLKDASGREVVGDYRAAEAILKELLAKNPQSLAGILSLERVLKIQNRLKDLIPALEQLLKVEPESPIGHQMLVRAYSTIDDEDEMRRAAESWIKATPKIEKPYSEIARVWLARADYGRALQYLEMGRSRINTPDALALELGDLYAAMEEYPRAVREWDRKIGPEARGFMLVQRRLANLPDGGAHMLPQLIDALLKSPTSVARRKAAAQLAIDAGLGNRADEIARSTFPAIPAPERQQFLIEMARRADGAQLPKLAYWAYSELVKIGAAAPREPGKVEQLLALRARVAELALALGDTAAAAETYRSLESAYVIGSPERRQATALRIQLTAREGKLTEAETELQLFRRDYPEAPELDAVTAAIGNAFFDKGDIDRAEVAVGNVNGPRSSLARTRFALRRGDVAQARNALMLAAPMLRGAEATDAIKLASALSRVSQEGGELMGQALTRASAGAPAEAVATLFAGARTLPGTEPAVILEMAASIAERNQLGIEAERARRSIIKDYPAAPEAPGALLALARTLAGRNETIGEAREHLEKLILDHPRSALVPHARQELDRLQGRVPRS